MRLWGKKYRVCGFVRLNLNISKLVYFGDPNLVTCYFSHLLLNKNTQLFTYSTDILVRLITANMKNCLTPKIRKCATPFFSNSIENVTP